MNKRRFLKILSLVLTVFTVISSVVYSSAETTEEKKAALKEKISELDNQIAANKEKINDLQDQINEKQAYASELYSQITALESQITALDQKISVVQEEIDDLNTEIKEKNDNILVLEDEIRATEEEIAQCEAEIEEDYEILKSRIRSLYMNGTMSELEVFFEADSFEAYLINLELIDGISKHDTKIINDIKTQVDNLNAKKQKIEENKAALEEARALLEEKKAEVETAKSELKEDQSSLQTAKKQIEANWEAANAVVAELDQTSEEYKALISKAETEKANFSAQIDALVAQVGSTGTGTVSGAGFINPLPYSSRYISCHYGRNGHGGTDITMSSAYGKNIVAVADGTVIVAGYHWSYGNYIVIDHGNGLSTYYAHCSQLNVSYGQTVTQGQVIGLVGSTGNSTGPHIHFEVRVNGSRRNPENYIPS